MLSIVIFIGNSAEAEVRNSVPWYVLGVESVVYNQKREAKHCKTVCRY
jgi:hypothetical protein